MNRIEQKFAELRRKKKKAFITFISAGDPTLAATEKLVLAFAKAGVDIVELGVPFSDPVADGATVQASSQRALTAGVSLKKILQLVAKIRRRSAIPIALMTYYNPVFAYGEKRFLAQARQAGVDGLIIADLPPEEGQTLIAAARRNHIATVFFLSPVTTKDRMAKIQKASTGFIYFVSVTGVTGARRDLPADFMRSVKMAKRISTKPICVGFGISTPEQVRAIGQVADGVIVGSAIIKEIEKHLRDKNMAEKVAGFVKRLMQGNN